MGKPTKSTHSEAYLRAIAALVDARKVRGIMQVDLAARLGKLQSYVSKFELRERRLDIVEFFRICRALEANPMEILLSAGLIDSEDLAASGSKRCADDLTPL